MKYEHPWVWLEMILDNLEISQEEFAKMIWKPVLEVNQIINWKKSVTPDWAFRICAVTGWKPSIWLSLQAKYDEQQYKNSKKYLNFLKIQKKAKSFMHSFEYAS